MEVVRKENCTIVILDENNEEKNLHVQEILINSVTFTFKTSENNITMPLSRLVKIKEKQHAGGGGE